jgi:hypothetical protein
MEEVLFTIRTLNEAEALVRHPLDHRAGHSDVLRLLLFSLLGHRRLHRLREVTDFLVRRDSAEITLTGVHVIDHDLVGLTQAHRACGLLIV